MRTKQFGISQIVNGHCHLAGNSGLGDSKTNQKVDQLSGPFGSTVIPKPCF